MSPPIPAGANKLYLDLFNATGSGKSLDIRGIFAVPKLDVAVTGLVAIRMDLYRTSAVGTGGTAAVRDNAASAAPDPAGGSFFRPDESLGALPAQITARTAPTGGATISRWLMPFNVQPEETNPAGYLSAGVNVMPEADCSGTRLIVPENSGLLIKQNAVASVGAVSIVIALNTRMPWQGSL